MDFLHCNIMKSEVEKKFEGIIFFKILFKCTPSYLSRGNVKTFLVCLTHFNVIKIITQILIPFHLSYDGLKKNQTQIFASSLFDVFPLFVLRNQQLINDGKKFDLNFAVSLYLL